MKKLALYFILFLIGVSFLISIPACGKKEKNQNELAVGNWTQFRNRAYILLITNPKGEWNSSVRIADATSKIVKSKGHAKGTWYIENGQMIFTVSESEIEEVWEKNATIFFEIIELTETIMQLKNKSGRIIVWKATNAKKAATSENDLSPIVPMGPVAVNLNKNRSNDKDRYLCLNMNLVLKELMPDQELSPIHPKAREAAVIFLSSLVFNDVKDFDRLKKQAGKLVDVLNPYMEGFIDKITIEHVIIATEIDKVEEFIIEHTLIEEPAPEEGEESKEGKENKN
jgi:hypothetical protein